MLENLIDLSGTAEESSFFKDGCPASQLMLLPHIWTSVRDLHDVHGVSEAMANIVPKSCRDIAFRPGQQDTSGQSIASTRRQTISSSKAQHILGKLVNRVRYDRYVESLEQLPEMTPPRGTGDPNGEKERSFAKARLSPIPLALGCAGIGPKEALEMQNTEMVHVYYVVPRR